MFDPEASWRQWGGGGHARFLFGPVGRLRQAAPTAALRLRCPGLGAAALLGGELSSEGSICDVGGARTPQRRQLQRVTVPIRLPRGAPCRPPSVVAPPAGWPDVTMVTQDGLQGLEVGPPPPVLSAPT